MDLSCYSNKQITIAFAIFMAATLVFLYALYFILLLHKKIRSSTIKPVRVFVEIFFIWNIFTIGVYLVFYVFVLIIKKFSLDVLASEFILTMLIFVIGGIAVYILQNTWRNDKHHFLNFFIKLHCAYKTKDVEEGIIYKITRNYFYLNHEDGSETQVPFATQSLKPITKINNLKKTQNEPGDSIQSPKITSRSNFFQKI